MYKVGDKFIIEIEEVYEKNEVSFCKIKGFNSFVVCENRLDDLKKYEPHSVSKEAGYEKGLSDAWECMKKILYMTVSEQREVFDNLEFSVGDILENLTPQESIEKLKAWEEKQEIQVGDVVDYSNVLIIATYINKENGTFSGIDANGENYISRRLSDCKKTGKHIDLTEIFKGLEGEDV